jgi:hypothetical protein
MDNAKGSLNSIEAGNLSFGSRLPFGWPPWSDQNIEKIIVAILVAHHDK